MKKLLNATNLTLSSMILLLTTVNAHATAFQVFADLSFANPASLNIIKQGELVIGGNTLFGNIHFTGTALGVGSSTTSRTTDLLPYGRLALRLSPDIVADVDITQPYYTDIQYPINSFISAFATSTIIRDTDISPKISYQVNPRLALGAGLNFNNLYNGQLNFSVPPLNNLTNKVDSWAIGWDVGLFYVITRATYLNLSYYSAIVQHAKGVSSWGPIANNNLSADVKFPATSTINIIQMLSPIWSLSATIRYSQWRPFQYAVLQNTALGGTVTVPEKLYSNVSTELATHYQFNDKWGGLAAIDYEPNIQPTYVRNPGLPNYTRFIPGIGAEYLLSKGLKAKLIYAHAFVKAPINMSISPGASIQGHDYVNVDSWDLSFTYDV